ncbi:MAG: hypothetical protein IJD97_00355 [Clostridia bacterium]|nr:hypothetical protein [Clostridia bacterium]
MEKLHKKTKLVFFSGLIYSLLITLLAAVFFLADSGLSPYAAKELVFAASEILSLSIIFSAFIEVFIRRFER